MTRSKYGAVRTERDGIKFDSKLEASRWSMLRSLQILGHISDLDRQVKFPLLVSGVKLGDYIADFCYSEGGTTVIEDAKGVLTPLCRWKLKHMEAQGHAVKLWPTPKPRKTRRKAI